MIEGEIYRKSGESESIGSVSGDSFQKVRAFDESDFVDESIACEKEAELEAACLESKTSARAEMLMQGKPRFLVSETVSAGPFAERIKKLKEAIASIVERLGKVND